MAYPVLYLTLSFMGGILAAAVMTLPAWAWACCAMASLFLAWVCHSHVRSLSKAWGMLLLTLFFLGAGLLSHHDRAYHRNSLHTLACAEYLDVEGTLYRSPSRRLDRDLLYLRVEAVAFHKRRIPLRGNLRISVPRSPHFFLQPRLLTGDRIHVAARLLPFPGYRNTPGASKERPFQLQNIHRLAHTKSPALVDLLSRGHGWSIPRAAASLRQAFRRVIERQFRNPTREILTQEGAVLEALLLGERGRLEDSTTRDFQAAGLFHLLAISGAHIAIVTFFLYAFVRRLPLTEGLRCILMLLALFFFSLLVEGRPSVVRACLMASLYLLGKALWKDVNLFNTLSISALILLWAHPVSLFDLGFQLTYAATCSILLFQPRMKHLFPRFPLRLHEILTVTLTAQMGVLPFSVRAFNRVTLAPLILNAAAFPLVAAIMVGGYAFLTIGGILPGLAAVAAWPVRLLLQALLALARFGSGMPILTYRIPTPALTACAAYTVFLLAFRLPRLFRGQAIVAAAGFTLSLAFLVLPPICPSRPGLAVSFIDVGHGDAILVELPGRETMLVDGGGQRDGSFDIGERVVSPFLWSRGIRRVDTLVLTHPHPDHGGGLQAVARNFRVGEFWEGESQAPSTLKELIGLQEDVSRSRLARGESFKRAGVGIEVLHPDPTDTNSAPEANRESLVLRLVYGDTGFLLTGDILAGSEREILEKGGEIGACVLKSPHHGSRYSSSRAFLEAVSPQIVVISCGRKRQGLPSHEVLRRYLKMGALVYRTDIHGAITVTSDGTTVSVRTVVPIPPLRTGYDP
jgi:competence protein ComEC